MKRKALGVTLCQLHRVPKHFLKLASVEAWGGDSGQGCEDLIRWGRRRGARRSGRRTLIGEVRGQWSEDGFKGQKEGGSESDKSAGKGWGWKFGDGARGPGRFPYLTSRKGTILRWID